MGLIEFDPFKVIKAALKNGGDFADVYVEDTVNTSIVCEENRIEKVVSGRDRGCGVRVIANFKTYYAYTNDLTERGLLEIAGIVSKGVKDGKKAGDIGLMKKEIAAGFDIRRVPYMADLQEKVELVKRADSTAWAVDKRIIQVKVVYGDGYKRFAVVNSLGGWAEEERAGLLFLCSAVSKENDVVQTGYEPIGGVIGLEVFEETPPEKVAETAAKRAIMMIGARRAPGGKMGVVLSSEAGGTMIHEAVGHGLEADLALQKLSVYSGKVGEKVASPLITVLDDSTIPYKRGSFFYDDEGIESQKTLLIDKGVLKSYMYDRLNAMKAGVESTGNGRRESY
ncbi:MAG: TldD/PmbA family protein, partial [Deltaproteobacteria bacterium]